MSGHGSVKVRKRVTIPWKEEKRMIALLVLFLVGSIVLGMLIAAL